MTDFMKDFFYIKVKSLVHVSSKSPVNHTSDSEQQQVNTWGSEQNTSDLIPASTVLHNIQPLHFE